MLAEFCKRVFNQGFRSPRIVVRLPKITKAIARLKLKNVADKEDAEEAMELYRASLIKFQKQVVIPQDPKDLACEKSVEIIKRFEKFGGISLEALFTTMCEENKQLATYFGYDVGKSLKIRDNIKTRDVYELIKKQRHPNIIIKDEKPVVLKWVCDPCDPCDPDKISKKVENEEKNNEKLDKNNLEPRSHTSHGSHSTHSKDEESDNSTDKLVKVSSKSPPIPMTNEQHDSFFGNK